MALDSLLPSPMLRLMSRPEAVPDGATLGIFAGSGPFEPDRLEAGVDRLRELGFTLRPAPGIEARTGFLAGDDDARRRGIETLLDEDAVDALVAARGGYGLTRILDGLPVERFRDARKWIVGFSDVTALHAHLSGAIETIHGPVLTHLGALEGDEALRLAAILRGDRPPPLDADGPVLRAGVAEGPLYGGNLAVLAALAGTPSLRPPEGAILLLEDVGEITYRLDRLFTQLRASGFLRRMAGIALGDFVDCRPAREDHPTALEVARERLGDLGVPVAAGFPVGHGARNQPVVLGRPYRLDASAGRLEALE